jgi:hypothetical protein
VARNRNVAVIVFPAASVNKWPALTKAFAKIYMILPLQEAQMIIEVALFLSFVAIIAGAIVVKAYEWRQDVLYGPYIKQNDWNK